MNNPIRIVALTEAGLALASALQSKLMQKAQACELQYKPQPFAEQVQQAFARGERLILICATGIAVRTLAPVIRNKHEDPPVLVLDENGQFVIPLLSGHEGGANSWAEEIALILGAQLVITTAKPYLRPVYTVGMGCERHCPESALMDLLEKCLAMKGMTVDQIASISSIDIKSDELGLIALAESIQKPYQTFTVETLREVEDQLNSKSDYVYETTGVYGVAESAALIAAQNCTEERAELYLSKQKSATATCAIARSYHHKSVIES